MPNENVLLLGASAVGKSCIFQKATNPEWEFLSEMQSTIAVTKPVVKHVKMDDDSNFKIKVWDCGGQERFQNISKAFLKDAVGCVIIFGIDNKESIEKAKTWIDSVNVLASGKNDDGDQPPKPIQIILAANKVDLDNTDKIEVPDWKNVGEALAKDTGDALGQEVPFFGTSAKNGLNIEELFKQMAVMIRKSKEKKDPVPAAPTPSGGDSCCIVS